MSAVFTLVLVIGCIVACSVINAQLINRRRDRARDEHVLERRRQRGGLV